LNKLNKGALFFLILLPLATAWWNPDWQYRVPATIQTNETWTDALVLITLDTQQLIGASKVKPDCGDIRVIDGDDETELQIYALSGCGKDTTNIYAIVPYVSPNKVIYVYYGNPSATLNTTETLVSPEVISAVLYDDFDGDVLDINKWETDTSAGSVSVSGGLLHLSSSSGSAYNHAWVISKQRFLCRFMRVEIKKFGCGSHYEYVLAGLVNDSYRGIYGDNYGIPYPSLSVADWRNQNKRGVYLIDDNGQGSWLTSLYVCGYNHTIEPSDSIVRVDGNDISTDFLLNHKYCRVAFSVDGDSSMTIDAVKVYSVAFSTILGAEETYTQPITEKPPEEVKKELKWIIPLVIVVAGGIIAFILLEEV